jgi:hypothetical protein
MDNVRGRINQDDPRWLETCAEAILALERTGELPADDLLRDVTLVEAELRALWRHKKGQDVADLMAAFDAARRARDEDRGPAVERVQALLRTEHERGTGAADSHSGIATHSLQASVPNRQ